jgi:hypothetical protein
MCGARTFMHSNMSLRGLTHFAPQLIALWREQLQAIHTMKAIDKRIEDSQQSDPVPMPNAAGARG